MQLDSELKLQQHVVKVSTVCFYQLRRLRQIRRLVVHQEAAQLNTAFILSYMDYYNSVLAGLPKTTIEPLQRAQNAAVCFVLYLCLHKYMTPTLKQLHWLLVAFWVRYKVNLLMHFIYTNQTPVYLGTWRTLCRRWRKLMGVWDLVLLSHWITLFRGPILNLVIGPSQLSVQSHGIHFPHPYVMLLILTFLKIA